MNIKGPLLINAIDINKPVVSNNKIEISSDEESSEENYYDDSNNCVGFDVSNDFHKENSIKKT